MNIHRKLTPYLGFIIVKTIETSESSVDIASDERNSPTVKGVVVAIGEGKLHESGAVMVSGVNIKDKIVFKTYNTDKIKLDGVDHRIVPFENIRGVLTNEKK